MEHLLIHKLASFAFFSLCRRSTVPFLSAERLCADPRLSPHALLAPDMALPTVFAEMIDNLATDEGAATRYEERREGGREGETTLLAPINVLSFIHLPPFLHSPSFISGLCSTRKWPSLEQCCTSWTWSTGAIDSPPCRGNPR